MIKTAILISFVFVSSSFLYGQVKAILPGDFADPSVIQSNGKYYSIGTSSEWGPHIPIYSSTDLTNWKQEGFVLNETPAWAKSSFWAPEYFYHQGKYYVYYSAKRKSDGVSCIGVATSIFPDRGFVDQGIVVAYGTESIDAFVVRDGNDLYMTWKAYGLDNRPIEILGSKLSADGKTLVGEPFSILQDTSRIGIEGQSFVQKDGYYYMFYSAGACCGPNCDYHVQAVRATQIQGPYERVGEPVLLGENNEWKCMGHGTFVKDTSDRLFYLFHGYNKIGHENTGRQGLLAELVWSDKQQPVFKFIPATKKPSLAFHYDFRKQRTDTVFWQWDFQHSRPSFSYTKDGLAFQANVSQTNQVGAVLALRPSTMNYTFETSIDLSKSSAQLFKGLVIYGDYENAIGVGIKNERLIVWRAGKGDVTELNTLPIPISTQKLDLRMRVHPDKSCQAFYKVGDEWQTLPNHEESLFTLDGLAPWDRAPRFGLHIAGDKDKVAIFTSFGYQEIE